MTARKPRANRPIAKDVEILPAAPAIFDPGQMVMMAVQQDAPIDKLDRLLELRTRFEKEEAEKAYIAAKSRFRSEMPEIEKDAKGHNDKSYASLSGAINQIKKALSSNGLDFSWALTQNDGLITVSCTITHVGGHKAAPVVLAAAPDGTGNKNAVQSVGSTVSYLERYTLFAALGLSSREMDNDGGDGSSATPPEVLDALRQAENVELLQLLFGKAWKQYPDKQCRSELLLVKDGRKKELLAQLDKEDPSE